MYVMKYKQPQATFPTDGELQSAHEVEGILRFAKLIVLYSQYETKLLGAYGPVVKKLVYSKLSATFFELVDHESWGLNRHLPRYY